MTSKADGTYQLVVRPGNGHLMVVGPTLDYIARETSSGALYRGGQPGGQRFYAHAIIAYDVRAGDAPRELNAILNPGKTLRGRLTGPAGETVDDAVILSRQQINSHNLGWEPYNFVHAHDGRFGLTGFDPEHATPVYFLDADHGWGAKVELSGKQAGEDLTIRLQPCGQAKARFVGPDGKPVANLEVWIYFQILMTPGSPAIRTGNRSHLLMAEGAYLPNVDRKHHPRNLMTGADGRVTMAALIPGAVPDQRLVHRQRPGQGLSDPQGIHRQAGRDARPGQHPGRETRHAMKEEDHLKGEKAMPTSTTASPWSRYQPAPGDPWDLRKVAHLHRRAGFGATRAELLRDLAAGPEASVERLFTPPTLATEDSEAIDGLRQTARSSSNLDLLKVCWLNRILHGPDPLREKLTLFWHGHFATSNKKVEAVALMDRQNETLRSHALGPLAAMLESIIPDPAMLVWLDGGNSKKDKPNENFAREFLELFTLGVGHYTERDIREAARAFTGWVRQEARGFQDTPAFNHDPAQVDKGPKTFLGLNGPWGPADIVRITLERPEAATFLRASSTAGSSANRPLPAPS